MNTGTIRSNYFYRVFIFNLVAIFSMLGLFTPQASASTPDAQFQQYLFGICNGDITAPPGVTWDTTTLAAMCFDLSGLSSSGGGVAANLGMANAGSGAGLLKKMEIREQIEDERKKVDKGAGADGGGWGLLVTPQYSDNARTETDLENGYQSKLTGLVIGLDYRFSDNFVMGGMLGRTNDKATFLNNAGSLKTSNSTAMLYGTWLPSEVAAFDGYIGFGRISYDGQRKVDVVVGLGGISGITDSSTSGKQVMAGVSASSQSDIGNLDISSFINFDYVRTSIDGYDETGTTTLEMRYSDRSVSSLTASLGLQVSSSIGYSWGAMVPAVRLAAVHEFRSDSQQINNELVSAPGSGFLVGTDDPDRNFLTAGLGLVAALNSGSQLFFNYEKRIRDRLLSSWVVSGGVLMEF